MLELVLKKIILLASDGASVNYDKDSQLIRLIARGFPWISFIWYFSHRLKLALTDALNDFIETVEVTNIMAFILFV